MHECGIRALCVESRPHPDFGGPHWWRDMDLVMDEARSRGMKVWLLDDKKFPTGYANGAFAEKHPDRAKLYLAERHMDLMGPVRDGSVLVQPFLPADARLLAVLAFPKPNAETLDVLPGGVIDLTGSLHDGFVYFTLPDGPYRLFVLFTTRTGGGRPGYMNLIDTESVKVFLDAVYQPHYERYRDDFGETFAGFFSDEPELGNTPGYDFHETIGKPDVKLPWSDELEAELRGAWGGDFTKNLPALWYGAGPQTPRLRYEYMDTVTRLVRQCFTGQVAGWCEAHGVEYIGHTIEDDNAHARMGCSVGHYFREMAPRHMGGVDVVHFQILPGFTGKAHRWLSWETDGEFFHFGLAKLAVSAAQLQPNKKGRAMCEIFGNYGWAEGVATMRWLTDHMLIRGVNHFVPHAFSPTYPDPDCPPHFYAGGNNPQFWYFGRLMAYMNRMAHLLYGGAHHTDAAVLYHGDSEWSGDEQGAMLCQKPMRALMQAQLGCHVVYDDLFGDGTATVKDGRLKINGNSYTSLVIPYCRYLPPQLAAFLAGAVQQGLDIVFVDGLPEADTLLRPLPELAQSCRVATLDSLAAAVGEKGRPEIRLGAPCADLRFLCVRHEKETVHFFFNESVTDLVDTDVQVLNGGYQGITWYDAVNDSSTGHSLRNNTYRLVLAPGEAAVAVLTASSPENPQPEWRLAEAWPLEIDWKVLACTPQAYPAFEEKYILKAGEALPNLNAPGYMPGFSGHFLYSGSFKAEPGRRVLLRLPRISDCARVRLNGKDAGCVLGGSGSVEVTGLMRPGDNVLEIATANTLVWVRRDGASTHLQVPPTGLALPPVLEYYEAWSGGSL